MLTGTPADSDPENISHDEAQGRHDPFGPSVRLSVLLNVRTGVLLGYRVSRDDADDVRILHELCRRSELGSSEQTPMILMDSDYSDRQAFAGSDRKRFRYLIKAKSSASFLKTGDGSRRSDFYDQKKLSSKSALLRPQSQAGHSGRRSGRDRFFLSFPQSRQGNDGDRRSPRSPGRLQQGMDERVRKSECRRISAS
ncbi:MAG: transposase [Sutterella sp.]